MTLRPQCTPPLPYTTLFRSHHRLVVLRGDHDVLQVQDDLGDVFLHTGDRGELVQHTVDADAGDRSSRDGGEQGAAQRVAQGVAETGLERLDDEPGAVLVDDVLGQGGALCNEHGDVLSAGVRYMTPCNAPRPSVRTRGSCGGRSLRRDGASAGGSRCAPAG